MGIDVLPKGADCRGNVLKGKRLAYLLCCPLEPMSSGALPVVICQLCQHTGFFLDMATGLGPFSRCLRAAQVAGQGGEDDLATFSILSLGESSRPVA